VNEPTIKQEVKLMGKLIRLIMLGILMLLTVTTVSASDSKAAIVIQGDTCWVPDASGSLEFNDLYEIPDCCVTVETNSTTGFKKFSCQAQLPDEALFPKRAMILDYESTGGFECWWDLEGLITTQHYLFTITPSGKVNFYCTFKD
jgi:hypothetical protein